MNRQARREAPQTEEFLADSLTRINRSAGSATRSRPSNITAVLVVAIFAVLTVATSVMALAELASPAADFGLRFSGGSDTVAFVVPGSPAANAGIRDGDVLEKFATSPRDYAFAEGVLQPTADKRIFVRMARGILERGVSLKAAPMKAKGAYAVATFFAVVATLTLLIVAACLVVMHPSWMTWGFFAFSLGSPVATLPSGTPVEIVPLWIMYLTLCFAASVAGMLIFLACFPNDTANYTWRIWVVRLAIVVAAVFFLALPNGILVGGTFRGLQLLGGHGSVAAQILIDVLYVIGGIAFTSSYFEASPRDRQRIAWVAVAIAGSILGAIPYLLSYAFSNVNLQYFLLALSSIILIPMPIAVAYAVLHHRVIDVKFAISRGLVYTILSAMLVAFFAALDLVIVSFESSARWTVAIEFAAAIATGFWLNNAHKHVDRSINQMLFRRRYEAEKRIARVVAALRHVETVAEIDDSLVTEPYANLELTAAALFRRTGSGEYVAESVLGWHADRINTIPSDARILLHLRGQEGAIRLRDIPLPGLPAADGTPVLAVPVLVRHRLEAITLYGAHRNGGDFDAEEIHSLETLASAAESAYDHLAARDAEIQIQALQAQLRAATSNG